MKKILLEYANMFAYAITGLVFGLSFFLLFINFYHMQELSLTVDVTALNDTNKASIQSKIETIKNNISVYDQSTYTGNLNIYALNNAKLKLESCVEVFERDEMMKYLELDQIGIKDAYNFTIDYKNNILNDCLVMQIKSMFSSDVIALLPNYNLIEPYVDNNINILLSSIDYVESNIENSDHYYFTTDNNKNNFFDLVNDSYSDTMKDYQNALDLVVEISNWYRSVVIGG